MPAPFTLEGWLTLGLTLLALVLFVTEAFSPAFVALLVVVALLLLGILGPEAALSGFSDPATITILALFIVSAGIYHSGIVELLARRLAAVTGGSERRVLLILVVVVGPASAFINNTAAVAILIPFVMTLARDMGRSPSRFLMPLSFLAMLAGTTTLVGTSTNIVASSLLADATGDGFGVFEFTSVGLVVFLTGSVYLLVVAPRLLPTRRATGGEDEEEAFLTEVRVELGSPLAGKTLGGGRAKARFKMDVVRVLRDDAAFDQPLHGLVVRVGDVLVCRVPRRRLAGLEADARVRVLPRMPRPEDAAGGPVHILEVVVVPGALARRGVTPRRLARTLDVQVLGLRHGSTALVQRVATSPLHVGDTLLVLASSASRERLRASGDVIIGDDLPHLPHQPLKSGLALTITAAAFTAAAADVVPLVTAALAAAVLMVVTRVLDPKTVWESIDWEVVLLIAGLLPLGLALGTTGVAAWAGGAVAEVGLGLPDVAVVAIFFAAGMLLTGALSNTGTVVLLVPVAVAAAEALLVRPEPLVLAVMFAASTDFLTPIGYQTNLMVYGAGGYRFTDFTRVGLPLSLILLVVTSVAIVAYFPLR